MRRSLEEPNSLRAIAPIIPMKPLCVAARRARVHRNAAGCRICGFFRACILANSGVRPDRPVSRDIGGGHSLVNWPFLLTFSSKSPLYSAIAMGERLRDCPALPLAASALIKDH